jgi:hypothetical protein
MWIISGLFLVVLGLAHLDAGMPKALRLHISEMRSVTVYAHLLFLLLITSGLYFARRANQERHRLSTLVGLLIALSVFIAWVTPTTSHVHNFFASAPFVLLFLYVPMMLFRGGHVLAGLVCLTTPPILDILLMIGDGGSSGGIQKANALMFLALLNFVYYKILPETYPLFYSPYVDNSPTSEVKRA